MLSMEELISRNSRKIADRQTKFGFQTLIWTMQLLLSKDARNLCVFAVTAGNFIGYYRFQKKISG